MPTPKYLLDLHEHYRAVAESTPRRLTPDEQRSLVYFTADIQHGESARDDGHPVARVNTWIHHAHELDDQIAEHGDVPRRNNRRPDQPLEDTELRLSMWLEDQRRPAAKARQCDYQRARIAAFPGVDARSRDERWFDTLAAYEEFLHLNGRVPVVRAGNDAERALALWATSQRRARTTGTISQDRSRALEALPIWTWGSTQAGR